MVMGRVLGCPKPGQDNICPIKFPIDLYLVFSFVMHLHIRDILLVICSSPVAYTLSLYVYIHEAFIIFFLLFKLWFNLTKTYH